MKFREALSTAVMFVGIFAFRSSIAEPFQVPTGSMIPTILPGDRLWVNKASYDLKVPFTDVVLMKLGTPHRGDVVVFRYPPDPSVHYVKRLIGLPGDQITVRDGFIEVNGKAIPAEQESRTLSRAILQERLEGKSYEVQRLPHQWDGRELTFRVPERSYFFMGDNRDNSSDSRFWGFVPEKNLQGKAVGIWLSLDGGETEHFQMPAFRWERVGKAL